MRPLIFIFLLLSLALTTSAVGVNVSWVNQTPADITTNNLINSHSLVQYNMTPTGVTINNTTAILYHNTNTSNGVFAYSNGTAEVGPFIMAGFNISDTLYNWTMEEDDIYPHTENYEEINFENTPHTALVLNGQADYACVDYLNVSDSKQYGWYEEMFNTSSTTPVRMYYCNESNPATSNPSTSPNCAQIASVVVDGVYNHCHINATDANNSCHQSIPFAVNTTTGTLAGTGVKVTPTSYFCIRGNTGGPVYIYGVNVSVRDGAVRTSANNGNSWANQSNFIIDGNFHQMTGNEVHNYWACINDTAGVQYCASTNQTDLLELAGLPPTPPTITIPENKTYLNGSTINITYTAALSPNQYPIVLYNISLIYLNGSIDKNIAQNNSPNLNYLWNTSGTTSGQWKISVEACDNFTQCSNGTSAIFTLDDATPQINITYPINGSAFGPNQCSFLTTANLTIYNTSTGGNASVALYLNGIYQSTKNISANVTGSYSANFTGLTQSANYSVLWSFSDNFGAAVNQTSWATLGAMAGCIVANLGITNTTTTLNTTIVYSKLSVPYIDIGQLVATILIGLAIAGGVHYAVILRQHA